MIDSKGKLTTGGKGNASDINHGRLLDEASENLTENGDKSSSGPQSKKGTEKKGSSKPTKKKK